MKKTKQFLSFILAVLMIFTAVPMQGFAFRLKPLEITGVEFETDTPISMRNVENQNVLKQILIHLFRAQRKSERLRSNPTIDLVFLSVCTHFSLLFKLKLGCTSEKCK